MRDAEAGSSFLELLFVALIVGLIAAAIIPNVLGVLKPSEESAPVSGAPNRGQALARWLDDPEASGVMGTPLGSDEDRQAYDGLVRELEEADLLEEWKRLLESRLSTDLRGQETDPEMIWSDGQPVTVLDEKP